MIAPESLCPSGEASVLVLQGGGALGSYQAGIRRIVGARHMIVDFTLPYGTVLHDYLA